MQETRVQFLGQKDPLEKGMAIHSSILAWRIPWTEEPGGLQSVGSQRVGHDWATNTTLLLLLVVVQSLSCVQLFMTPWTAACRLLCPVRHLLELAQIHVCWVSDAIQPSRPLSSPSPPALNLSQHQDLF